MSKETSYIQRIALAGRELAAGNVGRAEELLDECPTRPARLGVALPQAAALRQPASHAAHRHGRPRGLQPGRPADRHRLHGGTVAIRDSRTGQIVHELEHPTVLLGGALLRGMVYSPDGRYLAAARNDGKIRVWDPSSGQLLHTLEAHKSGQPGRLRSARTVERWHPVARIAVCACGT